MTFKHFVKNPIDNIKNLWWRFLAFLQYKGKIKSPELNPPSHYSLVFESDFSSKEGLEKDWRYAQPWGYFHPGSLNQWYDTKGDLAHVMDNTLHLDLVHQSKTYIKSELPDWRQVDELPDEFTIPYGIGLVVTKGEGWQYGWFECEMKLPLGNWHWPAFWLTGVNSWPPEIDIVEAYNDGDTPYYSEDDIFGKTKKFWRIQPNIHYGSTESDNKQMFGSYDVGVQDAGYRLVKYACHWTKDFIKIFYDGRLVMESRSKKVLEWFNDKEDKMCIILNHGHKNGGVPTESTMLVKNVKVYQDIS